MSVPVLERLFLCTQHGGSLHHPSRSAKLRSVASQFPGLRQSSARGAERTPRPNLKSQSLSRSYGSVLPTSLIYIVSSTRGCSPWRPDAVMSTTVPENESLPRVFTDRRKRAGHHEKCGALPAMYPYLRMNRFQGHWTVKKKRQLFPGLPPAFSSSFALPH